jgi:hypothetical protein
MAASPLTWWSGVNSQVDVMRDGTQVPKTPRSISLWTREVVRLSTPSCTVFGSSPTLTTKKILAVWKIVVSLTYEKERETL